MMYDAGPLNALLAAAVGEDPALQQELRAVFLESVERHAAALEKAGGAAQWTMAALKLEGLAASFDAADLLQLARDATQARAGEAAILVRLRDIITAI